MAVDPPGSGPLPLPAQPYPLSLPCAPWSPLPADQQTQRLPLIEPVPPQVVHDLLGQIMMRHSKAQTMAGPAGQRTALVALPPKEEEVLLLPLQDGSERAVYGELERLCREDFRAMEAAKAALSRAQADGAAREEIDALRAAKEQYRREDLLSPRDLQLVATHLSSLNLDATTGLEKKLAARSMRTRAPLVAGAASLEAASSESAPPLRHDEEEASLPTVETAAWDTTQPPPVARLIELHVWRCDGAPCHDGVRLTGLAPAGNAAASCFDAPQSTRAKANAAASDAAAAAQQIAASERMERSVTLDVQGLHFCSMQCAEAKFKRCLAPYCSVCHQEGHQNNASYWEEREVWDERNQRTRQVRTEKFVHPQGQYGVTNVQRNAMGNITNGSADHYTIVSKAWPSQALQGQVFANTSSACQALKAAIKAEPSFVHGSRWPGEPLYPRLCVAATAGGSAAAADAPVDGGKLARRVDSRLPCLSRFPASAPAGAFISHLDAAGAPRSYGRHHPFHGGTKVAAVLAELARLRDGVGDEGGDGSSERRQEKVVIFSDSQAVLEVLHEAIVRERGDGTVAMILGCTSFAERMDALAAFKERPACHVLLLSVGACASGLTLTHANHCFLLELQSHGGKEMQLINRVYRIGQDKKVMIKRFVAAGTVEERMLHLRKRSRGLLAHIDDAADTMAVSHVTDESLPSTSGGKAKASSASVAAEQQTERDEDLRYLYGWATPAETVEREQQQQQARGGEQVDDEEEGAMISSLMGPGGVEYVD